MVERLASIQLLRFLAAFIVVLHHLASQAAFFDGHHKFEIFRHGAVGVDIFFVISGFIMVYITHDRPTDPLVFLARRFVRVWPLYAIFTILTAAVVILAPGFYFGDGNGAYIAKSLLFIPTARSMDGQIWPIVGQGWTLNVEIVFYSLFALCLLARHRLAWLVTATAALIVASSYLPAEPDWARFYGRYGVVLAEFVLGALIAEFYCRGGRIPRWLAGCLFVIGWATILAPLASGRITSLGLPAAMIVLGALYLGEPTTARTRKGFCWLGDISFAVYLAHALVIQIAANALKASGFGWGAVPWFVFIPAVVALTVAVSAGAFRFVEVPIKDRVAKPLITSLQRARAEAKTA